MRGEGRAQREHEGQHDDVESREGVDIEPLVGAGHVALAGEHADPQVDRQHQFEQRDRDDRRQHVARPIQHERQDGPGDRQDQHRDQALLGEHDA